MSCGPEEFQKDIEDDYNTRSKMEKRISLVIPNYNRADTIGTCLEAAFSSEYGNFEVVVVDDKSEDNSVEVIKRFPCRLISLERHSGTSRARNIGAQKSSGEFIFFIDSDCLLQPDTLSIVNRTLMSLPSQGGVVLGGTYTRVSYDRGFFSAFQSLFVHYSETKNTENPDYIAAHAMVVPRKTFIESGGFPEDFMPILEDVAFSHRLKRSGVRLIMCPEIQVRHIFNFTLARSLFNAYRKTTYWCTYSFGNRDILTDSGSASFELKTNVVSLLLSFLVIALWAVTNRPSLLYAIPLLFLSNVIVSRNQIKLFYRTKGLLFTVSALCYYAFLYPVPIALGTATGFIRHFLRGRK
ncbi:MAG: glycosyltransferase family 2 protein [Nitrospiraceae bacterium]|nr:MAG: glycosyltransferase family 2 protein [Nitrospiraceae bacterium]